MLYQFSLTMPLEYNTFDIHSDDPSSEFIMGLKNSIIWDEEYAIKERIDESYVELYEATEKYHVTISCGIEQKEPKIPQSYFMISISGIVASSQENAYQLVEKVVLRSCHALSLLLNKYNANKQGYQPRVYPAHSKLTWEKAVYEPVEKLISAKEEEESTYTDENGVIHVCYTIKNNIEIFGSVYIKSFGFLPIEDFGKYYDLKNNEKADYLLEEYVSALGTERISSKFFHLFSMIEFVEKEYSDLAKAEALLDAGEINTLLYAMEAALNGNNQQKTLCDKEKRQKIFSRITDELNRMTDIGRVKKLVNILHNMGIKEIKDGGNCFTIDEAKIQPLINLRNTFFHGKKNKSQSKNSIGIQQGVTELMCICEKLVEYAVEQP